MMSTSLVASCLRMANISSCLRMVLAFSISCSSAKARSSGGVLDLRSCSFISRMRVVSYGSSGVWKKLKLTLEVEMRAGLGLGLVGAWPDAVDDPITQDRDSNASACVRWDVANIRKVRLFCKGRGWISDRRVTGSERLKHHHKHDQDHEDGRYLVED